MKDRSVLITGASSGIGRALALAYAAPGTVLHLGGRDAARLAESEAACRARGATVRSACIDVTDRAATQAWIAAAGRLDIAIANAGISAGTGQAGPEESEQVRAIFATNLDGMLNTALPALAAMRRQPPGADGVRGRLAVVASIAGFLPAPGAPAYCASKAAADLWAVGTATTARREGVRVTSVCPGYIRTPMTARNRFPMPGLMDADRAAALIVRGIAAGRERVVFPWWLALLARFGGALPPAWLGRALGELPGKERSQP
ncbi:MAG TPA: SDR family NAD(P)-dependent oxidoreductase [Acetobacteraceae bacterium]|nr:SDR family NAD(P)-dependent oxidoreductase [Acetobacteraceae bacterium]